MNILIILFLLWMQSVSTDQINIHANLKKLNNGQMNKKEFNDFIQLAKDQIILSKLNKDIPILASYELSVGVNDSTEKLGTAFFHLIKNIRNDLIQHKNINSSMLVLAMNNDISSLSYIKQQLYNADFIIQYNALKSLAIYSMFSNDLKEEIKIVGSKHWFIPIRNVTNFITTFLKNNSSITPWDIYNFNKNIDDIFWENIYQCNLSEIIEKTNGKSGNLSNDIYLKNLKEEYGILQTGIKLLSKNLSSFKVLLQSHNHLIGVENSENVININTKHLIPIYSFQIDNRVFIILRGLDSIGFDELQELVKGKGNYFLRPVFKLPYSTINISDEDKYLSINGNFWQIKINKKSMTIEKGKVCDKNIIINHGI